MDRMFGGQERKWPVYLLLDCSASMQGAPIIALNEGVYLLYSELMRDPQARERTWISLIRYANTASQDPLTPIDQFVPPTLSAASSAENERTTTRQSFWKRLRPAQPSKPKPSVSALGAALQILLDSIKQDLQPKSGKNRGDYPPLVFFFSSGLPTDSYHGPLTSIKGLRGSQKTTIIALGCGGGVNGQMLHEVTSEVYLMANVTRDQLRAFFRVISGSIVSASRP